MSDLQKIKKLRQSTGAGFKDCSAALEESKGALDKAVEEARADGANVTRDDWVFPNWDVYSNYGAEKYQEL